MDLEATQGGPKDGADGEAAADAAENFEVADEAEDSEEGEGPGMSLSALEEKLKPEVLATFEEIEALYKKLSKVQSRRLEALTLGEEVNAKSEKSYDKQREEVVGKVQQIRLHNTRIDELMVQLKQLNQRLNGMEGQLLRLAEATKVPRDDFLREYRGRELDPNWMERVAKLPGKSWKNFTAKHADQVGTVRAQIATVANEAGLPIGEFRRVYATVSRGERGQCAGEEGDDRGEPAPGDLDREEIHQPRPAIPGPDPGRQYRADEGRR